MNLMEPLLRKEKLTQNDWLKILELVRAKVKPKLERMKLKQFGELACIDSGDGFYKSLGTDVPTIGRYSLVDHGIAYFRDTNERVTSIGEEREFPAWGLTADGEWVIIRVKVKGVGGSAPDTISERPQSVSINAVSLEKMLEESDVSPFSVLSTIRMEVDTWKSRKQKLFEEAEEFASEISYLEDMILHGFMTPSDIF
ncbi:MAG: hypothetical protein KGI79_03510 [Patescibacteria group bacterium]|nr:hypothetical protein [Patescibacteria group bacterium]MDE2116915.1 hypothetical protein [Patescibacteria group bacterium]